MDMDHDLDHRSSASTSPENPPFRYHSDSDPDEADIDDHIQHAGPQGLIMRRSIRAGPGHDPHNPHADAVLDDFLNIIHNLGAPFGSGPRGRGDQSVFGQPHVHHHTTFTRNIGGTSANVTIFTTSHSPRPPGPRTGREGGDFQSYDYQVPTSAQAINTNSGHSIFDDVLRDAHPPEGEQRAAGPPPGFAQGLREILSLLNPGTGNIGDAVYSQEALDRIITNLMDANPQSNAAPPATEQALNSLERRPVTSEMLNGESSVDCTICIEELKEGDTSVFLPCKHWFHEDCVVLWLKEHNTCPICRTPIEKRDPEANRGSNDNVGGGESSATSPSLFGMGTASQAPGTRRIRQGSWLPPSRNLEDSTDAGGQAGAIPIPGAHRSVRFSPRPPSQSQSRLNEAMRSLSSRQQQERDRGTTSSFSYDTSRMQRRNSLSPTSPPISAPEEQRARMRQRSPSSSDRRGGSDRDTRRQTGGGGPLNWLRDRFSGGGSRDDQPT